MSRFQMIANVFAFGFDNSENFFRVGRMAAVCAAPVPLSFLSCTMITSASPSVWAYSGPRGKELRDHTNGRGWVNSQSMKESKIRR